MTLALAGALSASMACSSVYTLDNCATRFSSVPPVSLCYKESVSTVEYHKKKSHTANIKLLRLVELMKVLAFAPVQKIIVYFSVNSGQYVISWHWTHPCAILACICFSWASSEARTVSHSRTLSRAIVSLPVTSCSTYRIETWLGIRRIRLSRRKTS